MKTFFKDLWITEKETMKFYKRHPLGTIIFMIVSGAINKRKTRRIEPKKNLGSFFSRFFQCIL